MTTVRTIDEFGTIILTPIDGAEAVVCYELTESAPSTFNSLQYAWLAGSFDNGFFDSVFNSNPPGLVGSFAPIPIHDGTNWITDGSVEAALLATVLPLLQTQWPVLNSVKLTVDSGGTLFIDFYDMGDPSASLSGNTLGIGGGSQIFVLGEATVQVSGGTSTVSIRQVQLDGESTYYENGVEVTNSARIAQIQALIAAAAPNQVLTCPADGSETKIQAGTNVTVSGSGTTASPYVISAGDTDQQVLAISGNNLSISNGNSVALPVPDGSETIVTAGTNVTVTGAGTTANPYVVSSTGGGSAQTLVLHAMTNNATAFDNINIAKRTNYTNTVINTFGAGWNPTTGTLTVPTTGYYRVEAQVEANTNWGPSGYLNCRMFINDVNAQTPQGLRNQQWPDSGGTVILSSRLSRIVQLNAGDRIDVRVQGNPPTSTTANRPDHNYFVVEFIGS